MERNLHSLTIDGIRRSGDELVAHAITLLNSPDGRVRYGAFHQLIDDLITSDGPLMVNTSGTTGPPKRIAIPRADLFASARLTGGTFDLGPNDRALLCLPCEFIAGKMMVIRAMVLGLDLHIADPRGSILEDLDPSERFRFTAMVPNQLMRALSEDRRQVERQFDTILLGGGPVSEQLISAVRDLDVKVYQSYGSTETVTHVAVRLLNGPEDPGVFTALGEVDFGLDVRGCLVIYTPHLSTIQHVTNDLVELVDQTHFRWLGRVDNVILSGGKKIHPEKLEARTNTVVPYPHYFTAGSDQALGQAVVLVIETDKPDDAVIPEVMTALLGVLEKHELPRRIRTVPAFARTGTGKMIRKDP